MQTDKIILYVLSGLLTAGGVFMLLDKETNSLWSILPFGLATIIALLNKFKKVN